MKCKDSSDHCTIIAIVQVSVGIGTTFFQCNRYLLNTSKHCFSRPWRYDREQERDAPCPYRAYSLVVGKDSKKENTIISEVLRVWRNWNSDLRVPGTGWQCIYDKHLTWTNDMLLVLTTFVQSSREKQLYILNLNYDGLIVSFLWGLLISSYEYILIIIITVILYLLGKKWAM